MGIQDSAKNNTPVHMESTTEPLWTVDDVAKYLRLEPETVRKMARNGRLPAIKVGRVWRFKREKVKEWVTDASE